MLPAAFLSAIFLHRRGLAAAGIVVLATGMASNATLEASRIWLLLHLGRWSGWNGEPIWRNEQPVRYWIRTAMHAAIFAVYTAAAIFLIWSNLRWMAGR